MSDCLNAQLCRDGPACISVSGNLAELLDEELVMSSVEPKVAVATNINPKLVGGDHFHVTHLLVRFLTDNYFHFRWCLIQSVPEIKSKRGKKAFYYMVSHQNQPCLDRVYLQTQNDIDQNVVSVQTHAFGFFNQVELETSFRYALKGFTISIQVPQEPLYTACEVCFRPLKLSNRTTNWRPGTSDAVGNLLNNIL
ncbi:hypothetical protein F2Q69_00048212 [Brassica cretica]|uniref:Uncharacterized protein n=1 Tax=Brassica cretica TaxID=69181 RepID=A0A8S9PSZ1_BRACR|nr:hypothetical protein F2Q69_00048212 [Brassica cretica]